jgi:tetratricopeptide (TPR) repeat protein
MNSFWEVFLGGAAAVLSVALIVWALWRWLASTPEPGALIFRWVLTLLDLGFIIFLVAPTVGAGGLAALAGLGMAVVAGLIMALIWVPHLTDWVSRKLGALYDGGDVPPEPQAYYSIAEAKRKRGNYAEAAAEVQAQLAVFPYDFQGWMLLAEIQAENLHDLPGATASLESFVSQPGHAPKNVAFALNRLADWQLKYNRDAAAARQAFQRIIDLFPDSPEAHLAHQRLAHIAPPEMLARPETPAPLPVRQGEEDLGLQPGPSRLRLPGQPATARAAELARQLEQFPLDNQARQELAVLYAEGFDRLDLATEQLEWLIGQPHAPPGQVVHWLNLLADFQLKAGRDLQAARRTLERIIAADPDSAAAETAGRRLLTLGLEAKGQQAGQLVKLGAYEQDLGLKTRT